MEKREFYSWIIIVVLLVVIGVFWSKNREKTELIRQSESINKELSSEVTTWKNKYGEVVATKPAAEAPRKMVEKSYDKELAQIRKELEITKKELKSFFKAEITAVGSGTTVVQHDTIYSTFKIDDGYLNLVGELDSINVRYNYSYHDEILQAFHTKKKGLFGREQLFSSARLKNPNASVTNLTSVRIEEYKDKRFGLNVGVSYSPFTGQFLPTIGVGYNLIKF